MSGVNTSNPAPPGVTLTIDGREVTVPAGTNLVEAAKVAGVEVPHYCYHARLSVAGNCRMCLVSIGMPKRGPDGALVKDAEGKPEIAFIPQLKIGCATPVAEGMVVESSSPVVQKARQGVMEFLLVNHPLDCPICDQAGECRLQEFAVDYGRGESRFVELKVNKPKQVPLGEKILLDNERCIMCSRCERFMREVANHDCLGFTQRGSHVELACYPGKEPNTNYDLNIVDICPVGALTSKDFRFQMRPWFLKETRSVCSSCSTGCNVTVWSRDRQVYRLTPRDNDDVNQSWMCDRGRLRYRFINDARRLTRPLARSAAVGSDAQVAQAQVTQAQVTWASALSKCVELLESARQQPSRLAFVGSARATTEEQFVFAKLAQRLGAGWIDCVPHAGEADGFLQSADFTPNARGAALTGVAANPLGSRLAGLAKAIADGEVKHLVVLDEDLSSAGLTPELAGKLETLIVIASLPSPTTEAAHLVLPSSAWGEHAGTFINAKARLQRCDAAVAPPGDARPAALILANLLGRLGGSFVGETIPEIFRSLSEELILGVSTLSEVGDRGIPLRDAAGGAA